VKFLHTLDLASFNISYFIAGVFLFAALIAGFVFLSIRTLMREIGGNSAREQWLRANGAQGSGEILQVADTGVTINDIYPVVALTLKVSPSDGSKPFQATVQAPVSRVAIPRPGDVVALAYDREKPGDIALIR
jgi:hypothetical protein